MENKIYWFTGQPGSGKTVLSTKLKKILEENTNNKVFHIDGDELRTLYNNQKYGKEGRYENIKRAQDIAKFIHNSGHNVVVSLVAPYLELREEFKQTMGENLVELYIHTTETRGREQFHTDEYEKPTENFIDVDTTSISPEETIKTIVKSLDIELTDVDNLDKKKTIAIDFDGVIHAYSKGYRGADNIYDKPLDGTEQALQQLKDDGFTLKILSSRPKKFIKPWLEKYNLDKYITDISNHKFPATLYIDDRGFHFKNWGQCLTNIKNHPKIQK